MSTPAPRIRAFTLIELLTVIAIIGILAAIIIPVVGSVRNTARISQATSNVRQLQTANELFAADNRGRYAPQRVSAGGAWWYSNRFYLKYLGFNYETNPNWSATNKIGDTIPLMLSNVPNRPSDRHWPDFGYNRTGLIDAQLVDGYQQIRLREPSNRIAFIDSRFVLVRVQDIELYDGTETRVGFEPAYRHNNRALVAFFDGSVRMIPRDALVSLDNRAWWDPTR